MKKQLLSLAFSLLGAPVALTRRDLSTDLAAMKGPHSQVFRFCVGAGQPNEGLRAD